MITKNIKQEAILPCLPQAAFTAWMDSKIHGEMTGSKAKIDPKVGGKFTAWDGYIQGETVELDPKKHKIIQSWRSNEDNWPKDFFSKITIEFLPHNKTQTKVKFVQTGVPKEYEKDVEQGWKDFYWKPMRQYFSFND